MKDKQQIDPSVSRLLCDGDHIAFMQVYDTYHQLLFNFIVRYISNRNQAEDILHDVFMKLWETRQRINPELPLLPYLYKITRNSVYKALQEQYKLAVLRNGLEKKYEKEAAASPAEAFQHREYDELFQHAVALLPAQRQKVFQLCRLQGNNYQEVAQQLGISRNTVKEHMSLAIKSINDYVSSRTIIIVYALACNLCQYMY